MVTTGAVVELPAPEVVVDAVVVGDEPSVVVEPVDPELHPARTSPTTSAPAATPARLLTAITIRPRYPSDQIGWPGPDLTPPPPPNAGPGWCRPVRAR